MTNILNIGQSALMAAQVAISTTGHNITNASTDGYTRQEVEFAAKAGQATGYGYVGKGVEVQTIKRLYSQYLTDQVNTTQTTKGKLDTYYKQAQQIDNMLSDSTVGLTPALSSFFSGVGDLSSDPSSTTTRQSLLSTADSLVARFQSQANQLNEINQGVNDQITSTVTSINAYAEQIATLNTAIQNATAQSSDTPNDLLDQRDLLISKLSEQVQVSVVDQDNAFNVYIGTGQPLVIGQNTYSLAAVQSTSDPSKLEVAYQTKSGTSFTLSEQTLSGGNLAGLLEFRSKTLEPAQNTIGRIATVLATTFNAQHELGQDLNGALGGAFFSVGAPAVYADTGNTGTAAASASITNASALTTSDYQLKYDGTNYTLTRLSDNKVLSNTTLVAAQTATTAEGFSLNVTGTPGTGDSFLIKPTANGASGIGLAITDTSKIAAAAPVRTSATTTNTGTGKISEGVVNSLDTNLTQAVTIKFTSATTYTVTGTGIPAGTTGTYTEGADISYNGWTMQISGKPALNDTFTIGPNTSGTGDKRNALLLGQLQTANLVSGTTSYQGSYSQLVNTIGNKTSELESTSSAADTAYTSAVTAQQTESGVNIDEEAANLIRYQQAYQAAAKVMKTANDIFDSLLAVLN